MNTKVVKSFGLALIVAVGVLALLLATGTFSPQKAGAQTIADDGGTISVNPSTVAAGTNTPLTVGFLISDAAITSGSEINIELPGFDLPDTIATSAVSIRGGGAAGTPASVAVSGQVIAVEVGNDSGGVPMFIAGGAETGQIYVTFTRAAGISTGGVAGTHNIKVNDVADADDFSITPSVTLSHEAGFTSTKLVVTGAYFPAGTATIRVDDSGTTAPGGTETVATPAIVDGGFEYEIDIEAVALTATATNDQFEFGTNYVWVSHPDLTGTTIAQAQKFDLGAKVTAPKDGLVRGDKLVTIEVEEGPSEGVITGISVGGTDVPFAPKAEGTETQADPTPTPTGGEDAEDNPLEVGTRTLNTDGEITFVINVEGVSAKSDATLAVLVAENTLTPNDADSDPDIIGSVKVDVVSLTLSLSPDTAVQGMTVTLTGNGFNDGTDVQSLMVGGTPRMVEATSNTRGQFVIPFTVPDLEGGTEDGHEVVLTGMGGRIGEAILTVPMPTTTIEPAESRIGTSVGVTGTGFPANDPILIKYDGQTAGSANSNNVGEWKGTFLVPVAAEPGDTKFVQACRPDLGEGKAERCSGAEVVSHSVPGASAELSATEARSGDTITVTGVDYKPYNPVTITIGTAEAKGTVSPDGTFSVAIQLPLLAPGPQLLTVNVGGDTSTYFLTALGADAVVSTDPADVFADLIEAGVLESVWIFDNDADKYQGFNPNATDAERALAQTLGLLLTEVGSGDGGWMNLNADAEFQGTSYKAGWRLVFIR